MVVDSFEDRLVSSTPVSDCWNEDPCDCNCEELFPLRLNNVKWEEMDKLFFWCCRKAETCSDDDVPKIEGGNVPDGNNAEDCWNCLPPVVDNNELELVVI